MSWYARLKVAHSQPYGYWVTPEGKRIPVRGPDEPGHLNALIELNIAHSPQTAYDDAFDLGWARVTTYGGPDNPGSIDMTIIPTPIQASVLEAIMDESRKRHCMVSLPGSRGTFNVAFDLGKVLRGRKRGVQSMNADTVGEWENRE